MSHVLVVDSDSRTREGLHGQLSAGYRISWAATASEGERILRRSGAQLVILETHLPDRCGLELLGILAARDPGLPVIIVTAFGSESVCASALRLGARDYFPKPVDPAVLSAAIRRLLPTQPLRSPAFSVFSPHRTLWRAHGAEAVDVRVDRAIRYVDDHSREPLTLSWLARLAGMSVFALSRAMTARGVPFRTSLLRRRVTDAQTLLTEYPVSMVDVAETAGFGDVSRFNKVFLKYAGMTPSAYRTRAKSAQKKARNA